MIYWCIREHPTLTEIHAVIDSLGQFEIDESYREEGERDGWLVYSGYYRRPDGVVIHTYSHK